MLPFRKMHRASLEVAGLFIVLLLFVDVGTPASALTFLLSNILQTALVVFAAYCCFRTALYSRGYWRQFWVLFSVALAIAGTGKALAAYYQYHAYVPSAAQWPSDALSILWAAPAVMMFLMPSAVDTNEIDWWQILDFAQVAIVSLSAYLYFVYVPSISQAHDPQMIRRVLLGQLIRDVAIGAGFLVRAANSSKHPIGPFFRGMFYFFLVASAADLISLLGPRNFPNTANWMDLVWCAPYLFAIVFSSSWKLAEKPVVQEMSFPFGAKVVSLILPIGLPLLVLLMGMAIVAEEMTVALVIISASFLLSTVRLILTGEKQRRIANDFLQAERALLQSEGMFSAAFRLSPDAMAINEAPGGRFLEVNDSFTRLIGFTREEVIGRTGSELCLWVDLDHRARVTARLREGSEVRDEVFYCRTKLGKTRTFLLSGKVIEQGGRTLSLTLARDITAHKQAEESLRANEERFRTLIEDMNVGILMLGSDAEVRFANQAVLDIFGLKREQVLENGISELYLTPAHEDGTKIPSSLLPGARAIETRQTIRNEVIGWQRSESNEVLWTLIDAIPQFSDRGEVASVILSITNITEVKRAEEALRRSENLFRTLVENLHLGIALIGADQEIRFANEACLTMFGRTEKEVVGKKAENLSMSPVNDDGTEIPISMRPVARVIATRQAVLNEVMGWRRAGSDEVLWLRGEAVPLFDKNGELEGVITSFSDISQRKKAEEALRASEERFRTLVENLHVAVVLLGLDQEIQFTNRAGVEMFGMKEEEVLGKRVKDIGPIPLYEDGTEMPFSMLPVARVIETGKSVLGLVMGWRIPASNDVLWIQVDTVPLFGANGKVERVISAFSDITQRKKAEEALRNSEKLFRTLVENTHMAVALLGPNQEIQFVNQAALNMVRMGSEEVVGRKIADLGMTAVKEDGTEMPFSMRPAPRAAASGQSVLNERMGWRFPGSNNILWIQGGVVPLFGENGELVQLIASFSDVTQMKKAEEALRASEELFRTLVENLHVGISLIGPNQEILFANEASSRMFGLEYGQSLGKTTIDLGMTPLNEDGTVMTPSMRPVARSVATRKPVLNWVMGWRIPNADDVLWIQGEAVPLFGNNGEMKSVIAAYSDITKRKKSDEALRQLSTRLLQLQDEERRRVGRELHDVLGQSVMAVNLDLARVVRSPLPLDNEAKRALFDARSILAEMSREIRTLSYTLHPPVLDELGLVSAIQEFSSGFS